MDALPDYPRRLQAISHLSRHMLQLASMSSRLCRSSLRRFGLSRVAIRSDASIHHNALVTMQGRASVHMEDTLVTTAQRISLIRSVAAVACRTFQDLKISGKLLRWHRQTPLHRTALWEPLGFKRGQLAYKKRDW